MFYIVLALIAVALLVFYVYWDNNSINVKRFTVFSNRLPKGFDGYVIAHVSDLHNKLYKNDNAQLLTKIRKINPDIIVVTGDVINGTVGLIDNAIHFLEQAANIAPVYFTPGNHEAKKPHVYDLFVKSIKNIDRLTVLSDKKTTLSKNGDTIDLLGLCDPLFFEDESNVGKRLFELCSGDNYKLLLSHRPEIIDVYAENLIDLALCGHTHAGQMRYPFFGSLYIPNQGFLPVYDVGRYDLHDTVMLISGGLGFSGVPRFLNRPQLLKVVLKNGTEE